MSKKEIDLDNLAAISGGVGSPETGGMDIYFPNKDGFHSWCLEQGISNQEEQNLLSKFSNSGLTLHFSNGHWKTP